MGIADVRSKMHVERFPIFPSRLRSILKVGPRPCDSDREYEYKRTLIQSLLLGGGSTYSVPCVNPEP